jgi:ZIP family zinc transporter
MADTLTTTPLAPPAPAPASPSSRGRIILMVLAPLVLLAAVIATFLLTDGAGLNVAPVVPIETVQFDRTVLTPNQIELHFRNTSHEPIDIAQINVNDAIWPFTVSQDPIPRLGSATITLDYPWVEGDAYGITLLTSNSVLIDTAIDAAASTPITDGSTLWSLALVGVYVGIIPVILGMLWLPVLSRLSRKWNRFLMAATVGLLIFLGIDATAEAVEQAGLLAAPLQGLGIVGIGIALTFALLQAIGQRQQSAATPEARQLGFATMIAIGIGLHNLGEGLAIGASFAVGAAALGTFLVIGFIIQNITEGMGIVVPLARQRPTLQRLALLAVIGGAPAIVGTWVGGLTTSSAPAVLFLAVGAGAVFQVAFSIGRSLVWRAEEQADRRMPLTAFSGLAAGMLVLYVMGVFLK